MGKLTFIAGMAAGYVLGSRAGRQRYEQIRRTSGKVWNSGPVQKQVFNAKEVARTKAAPVVADMVADAARATGEKLRSSRTVEAEAIGTGTTSSRPRAGRHPRRPAPAPTPGPPPRRAHEALPEPLRSGDRSRVHDPCSSLGPGTGTPATPVCCAPCGAAPGVAGSPYCGTVVPCTAPSEKRGAATPLGSACRPAGP